MKLVASNEIPEDVKLSIVRLEKHKWFFNAGWGIRGTARTRWGARRKAEKLIAKHLTPPAPWVSN